MRTLPWLLTAALVSLGALTPGCDGGNKKKAEAPDPDEQPAPNSGDDDDEGSGHDGSGEDGSGEGNDDDSGGEEPGEKPKPKPVSRADDYEINETDCDALAEARGRAWYNDEVKKLEGKKLSEKQHDAMVETLEKGEASVADNYREECNKTVGTAYLRSSLECAVKAKSIKAFDDCMAGKNE